MRSRRRTHGSAVGVPGEGDLRNAVGGFIEIPGEMNLALMMGLVPGEQHDGLGDGTGLSTGGGNLAQKGLGSLLGCEFFEGVVGRRQFLANHGQRGDVGVGRGRSTGEMGDQFLVLDGSLQDAGVEISIVCGGAMHRLPGDVGAAGTRTPGENLGHVLTALLDGIQSRQQSRSGEFQGED